MSEMSATSQTGSGSPICLKGTTQGFEILIESAHPADMIASEIQAKLEEAPGFFKGGDVILRFDDAPPRGYLGPIEEVTDRYELRIVGVQGPGKSAEEKSAHDLASEMGLVEPVLATGSEPIGPDLAAVALDAGNAIASTEVSNETIASRDPASAEGEALAPKMIVGPVRSGCILEVAGHLIILGDVNPGAEVRATGSIVVLGRLRGIAHAGSSAFILALQLEPQQLRIGSLVARAGDADAAPERAEIAYAKDGAIMVDNYKGRLPFGIATAKF